MNEIPIIGPSGNYKSKDKLIVRSITGEELYLISSAGPLLSYKYISELRSSNIQSSADILDAISKAGKIFATDILENESPDDYINNVHLTTGLPINTVKSNLAFMNSYLDILPGIASRESKASLKISETEEGSQIYHAKTRKGKILGAIVPGNHPSTHQAWLKALAYGYKIALKPSLKDPFTPLRLMRALLKAGIDPTMLAYLPGKHDTANEIVKSSDISIVYGGPNVSKRFGNKQNVIVHGPGYSKIFTDESYSRNHENICDTIVSSICHDGGVRCTNASGIIVQGRVSHIYEELLSKFRSYKPLPLGSQEGTLPLFKLDEAVQISKNLDNFVKKIETSHISIPYDRRVVDFGDGTATLLPTLFIISGAMKTAPTYELPFPSAWLSSFNCDHEPFQLSNSLSLSIISHNKEIFSKAINDHTIRKVLWGPIPTWWTDFELPHDGILEKRLFDIKGLAIHNTVKRKENNELQ